MKTSRLLAGLETDHCKDFEDSRPGKDFPFNRCQQKTSSSRPPTEPSRDIAGIFGANPDTANDPKDFGDSRDVYNGSGTDAF